MLAKPANSGAVAVCNEFLRQSWGHQSVHTCPPMIYLKYKIESKIVSKRYFTDSTNSPTLEVFNDLYGNEFHIDSF